MDSTIAVIDGRTCTVMSEGALKIFIFNLRDGATETGVYRLERQSRSPLANPFIMDSERDRHWACQCFDKLLNNGAYRGVTMTHQGARLMHTLELELRKNGELKLACWCAPNRCHVESVARVLLQRLRDMV